MRTRFDESAAVAAFMIAASGTTAIAQLGPRVNDNYSSNPTTGLYHTVQNAGNFKVVVGGQNRMIPMADPTILKIGTIYYVTGTSDAAACGNFAIYKSTDLVNWTKHMLAFANQEEVNLTTSYNTILDGPFGGAGTGYTVTHPRINNRRFSDFWGPQLYYDSASDKVYLSFTVAEHAFDYNCNPPNWTGMQSIQVASISKTNFVAGGSANNFAAADTTEPHAYRYFQNNAGSTSLQDGGYAQGHAIPVTGSPSKYSACDPTPNNGDVFLDGQAWAFGLMGSAPFMALDSFVYRDTTVSPNKLWMMYTWRAVQPTDMGFNGNNVAAYPMNDNRTMDAYGSLMPIAYRWHWYYWPPMAGTACSTPVPASPPVPPVPPLGWILNGNSDHLGRRIGGCSSQFAIAEAPAAFTRNSNTYVLYSRNEWSAAAYGIFYRVGQGANFSQMYLRDNSNAMSWNDPDYGEAPIVWSVNRGTPGGRSYGSGEVFQGPTASGQEQRYYLIYHAKEQSTTETTFPNGYSGRTVYFKELRFDANGYITSFSDNAAANATDADLFLVPH